MLQYSLLLHDGEGNFHLIQDFRANGDEAAAKVAARFPHLRPLELWQSTRKVRRWA